jgi:hypothetical protein
VSALPRRTVLRGIAAGAVAATLAACTRGSGEPAPTAPGGPEDPDRALRAEIGRSETELIDLYAATAALVPASAAAQVREIGARHEAYRQAIDPDGLATASPSAEATSAATEATATAPSASASASATPVPLPTAPLSVDAAARLLRSAELSTARARVPQSVLAVDEELARVVALAGAGCAAAAEQLRGGLG